MTALHECDDAHYFKDVVEFFDDVWGCVRLNRLERDCVDTPEFQRLFRIGQLGLVDLVYHTANHTRGIHSIGACGRSKVLVDFLNENTPRIGTMRTDAGEEQVVLPQITRAERGLISLAALLHDLPHAPFSHDIERKTHRFGHGKTKLRSHYGPYPKHDDFSANPALYILLFDQRKSILARVLRHYSPCFWRLLREDGETDLGAHLRAFVASAGRWPEANRSESILPSLLFHLLVFEDLTDAIRAASITLTTEFNGPERQWGLGPQDLWADLHDAWYQPYRHDIVGDTLSADLLDYIHRDAKRLGMQESIDFKLLDFYTLVPVPMTSLSVPDHERVIDIQGRAQCAIDLNDYKRGVIRSERINDVFRMLDIRHVIHEKAVYHRVVQGAIAMLARAVALAGDAKPKLEDLYRFGRSDHALYGDDLFLRDISELPRVHLGGRHSRLARKLTERRIYRPLMIMSGDQAYTLLKGPLDNETSTHDQREETLRLLGAILDSTHFAAFFCLTCWCVERFLEHSLGSIAAIDEFVDSNVIHGENLSWVRNILPRRVILWTTPYKQLYKDPGIVVRAGEEVGRIDELVRRANDPNLTSLLPSSVLSRLRAGLQNAESQYAAMWKIYVFASDGLFYTGGLARLIPRHECRTDRDAHRAHLQQAEAFLIRAIHTAWDWWVRETAHGGQRDLSQPMSDSDLKRLFQVCTGYSVADHSRIIAGVDFDSYVHVDSEDNCRDVRYRYDFPADIDQCISEAGLGPQAADALTELLRLAQIDRATLGHQELADIVARLGPSLFQLLPVTAQAAFVGVEIDPHDLCGRWIRAELDQCGYSENAATRDETLPGNTGSAQLGRAAKGGRQKGPRRASQLGIMDDSSPPLPNRDQVPDTPGPDI
jgi:HD superfamily phosphohydrolase